MNNQDLRFYQFPAGTSDKEKIIFAKKHNYSVRLISGSFGFGNAKIGRIWKQYKETNSIPKPLKKCPHSKLTPNVLNEY